MMPHESAHLHVTGQARYTDDEPLPPGGLHAWLVVSPHARARVVRRASAQALAMPGVAAVLWAADIPGQNRVGPIVRDEPLLAEEEVWFRGQSVALVLAETREQARRAAAAVQVAYEPLPTCLTIAQAIAAGRYHGEPHIIARGGDVQAALRAAPVVIHAEVSSGAQDHFYLETQSALALPEEDGMLRILSSTQHPTEVQRLAAAVLGIQEHRIVSEVRRLGGGFGGKESQASPFAALAALGAAHTGRAVRLFLDRDQDMVQTGKRHPFWSRYSMGVDETGRILALDVETFGDGGWSQDLSLAVLDRALFHLDGAYFVPTLRFAGRICRTDLPSNTAFRGFGGPQGMVVIEDALNRCAERLGLDPAWVRARNLYTDAEPGRDRTPYGQHVPAPRLAPLWDTLSQTAHYHSRRAEIQAFNARSPHLKRGLGYQPVKFGISFTKALLNQAGALVVVYADGSVQINHSGAEMGQGLHTKMRTVAAHHLGVTEDHVRVMVTSTEKVPNTSPTAASSGTDLNGQAVAAACTALRDRLAPLAARLLGVAPEAVHFRDGAVWAAGAPPLPFSRVATQAWLERVPLSATGFYATPGVTYDHARGEGTPFFYFAYGGAISEVEVSTLTGEHRLLRVDILHDVGDSLSPGIDIGQIEGGFVQGWGWLTCEEVRYGPAGQLLTHSPSTYKIPAAGDVPLDLRVALLEDAREPAVIGGSKAVGEPPLMLALSTVTALRHAIAACGPPQTEVSLALPCTPEAVLRAIYRQSTGTEP